MGRRIVKKSVLKEEPLAKTFSVKTGKIFVGCGILFLALFIFINQFPTNLDGSRELPLINAFCMSVSVFIIIVGCVFILLGNYSVKYQRWAEKRMLEEAAQILDGQSKKTVLSALAVFALIIIIMFIVPTILLGKYRENTYTEPICPKDYEITELFIENENSLEEDYLFTVNYTINGILYTDEIQTNPAEGEKIRKMFDAGEQAEELFGTLYYHPDNPGYIGRREVKKESSE